MRPHTLRRNVRPCRTNRGRHARVTAALIRKALSVSRSDKQPTFTHQCAENGRKGEEK